MVGSTSSTCISIGLDAVVVSDDSVWSWTVAPWDRFHSHDGDFVHECVHSCVH